MENTSNEKNDYSIFTEVPVGRSFMHKGWMLKKHDLDELIPRNAYEGDCEIEIDNIRAPAKIIMKARLFYESKEVSQHLKELYNLNHNKKIKIEIKTNKKNLYSNFIPQLKYSEKLDVVRLKLPIHTIFTKEICTLNKDFTSQIFPLNQIPQEYEIIVDGMKTRGRLNIVFTLKFNNKKLGNHLKELLALSPNLSILVSIFLNKNLTLYKSDKNNKGFYFFYKDDNSKKEEDENNKGFYFFYYGDDSKKEEGKINQSNFKTYEGDKPYIFISYKHDDKDKISPIVKRLDNAGLNIWCDNKLEYGVDYDDIIDEKIAHCSSFVIFITKTVIDKAYESNEYMKKELNVATILEKKILPIFIDNVELQGKYRLQLSNLHSIFKYEYEDEEEFFKECIKTLKKY